MRKRRGRAAAAKRGRAAAAGGGGGGGGGGNGKGKRKRGWGDFLPSEDEQEEEEEDEDVDELEGLGADGGKGGRAMPTEAEKRKWPKVLVFAHHSVRACVGFWGAVCVSSSVHSTKRASQPQQEVMDLLERGLRGMGVNLIRIDGTTPPQRR